MLWKQPKQLLKQQAALQQFLSTNFQVLLSMQSLILKKLLLIICLKISSVGMPSKFLKAMIRYLKSLTFQMQLLLIFKRILKLQKMKWTMMLKALLQMKDTFTFLQLLKLYIKKLIKVSFQLQIKLIKLLQTEF